MVDQQLQKSEFIIVKNKTIIGLKLKIFITG